MSDTEIQREKRRERSRQYYLKNREAILARTRAYADAHREERRALSKVKYLKNRKKILEDARARYYAKSGRTVPSATVTVQAEPREKFDWSCTAGCGRQTQSTTGVCRSCSQVPCSLCGNPFSPRWTGQKTHKHCQLKEVKRHERID